MTPYQRIMLAAKRGTGVRLTADEVWQMSNDTAIADRAAVDDDKDAKQGNAGVPGRDPRELLTIALDALKQAKTVMPAGNAWHVVTDAIMQLEHADGVAPSGEVKPQEPGDA